MTYFSKFSSISKVRRMQKILEKVYHWYPEKITAVSAGLEPTHAQNTLEWVLKINPRASVALQIAALAHDIDRIIHEWQGYDGYGRDDLDHYQNYKASHAQRSADFVAQEMSRTPDYPKSLIERVKFLIAHHDDQEADDIETKILQAADALSFFSVLLPQAHAKLGKDVRLKIKFSLNKIPKKLRCHLEENKIPKEVRKVLEEI